MASQTLSLNDDKRLTKDFLKKLLRKDFRLYYSTPYLNDCLYLHYKGFDRIENLEEFTGLKVIYLEGNGLSKIEGQTSNLIQGLEALVNLRCLYLQENLIKKMENMHMLKDLVNLNLTDNCIEKIEGLEQCTRIQTVQLKRNRIGTNGLQDLYGILQAPSVTVLDLQDNKVDDINILEEIFEKLPNLAVLYFQNNPAVKNIKNYRKTYIHKIANLKYLDDKPVFPEERRFCEAFAIGGLDLEREERAKYKKEQEDQHLANHLAFRAMMENYRKQAQEQEGEQQEAVAQPAEQSSQPQSDAEVESTQSAPLNPSDLPTYNSEPSDNNKSDLSKSSSQQSLRRDEIEIKKIDFFQAENENSLAGVNEDGSTFCTQAQFQKGIDYDELD